MNKLYLFLVCFIVCSIKSNADTLTIIHGNNISYANQVLKVMVHDDFITNDHRVLACDTVDSLGNFSFIFPLEETHIFNMELGIYNGLLFVEPNRSYEILLPEFHKKSQADILNPYFKPIEIYIGIKNRDSLDINFLIAEFNDMYHKFIDQHYYAVIKNPRNEMVETIIDSLEMKYTTVNNDYFKSYRIYKYAWLKYISVMRDSRFIVREYFDHKPICYNNPAYMDLFNQIFTNYLGYYKETKEGERLYSDIALAKSPTYVKQTFSNNLALTNDTLQEIVLLKGIFDAFYTKDYPINSLLIILDSIQTNSSVSIHKNIATNIKQKVLRAKAGFPAPEFELRDPNGVIRNRIDYLSNYVYLNFISIDSYACIDQLIMLNKLYEKHKNSFRIVSISIDSDFGKVKEYFKAQNYSWMLLDGYGNEELIKNYRVKTFPSYYLINPKGLLEMSPAPSPAENFEWYFFTMQRNKQRNSNK